MTDRLERDAAIEMLESPVAAQRRRGAKQLMRSPSAGACVALLEALELELTRPKCWESQYKMLLAIGFCECRAAEPRLWELVEEPFDATILYMGIGDALLRLGRARASAGDQIDRLIAVVNGDRHPFLLYGALRACDATATVLDAPRIDVLVDLARRRDTVERTRTSPHDDAGLQQPLAGAAFHWDFTPSLEALLVRGRDSNNSGMRRCCKEALERKRARPSLY
jgi:hypothetical protein